MVRHGRYSRLERTRRIDFGGGYPAFKECILIFTFHGRPANVSGDHSCNAVNCGIEPKLV